MTEEEAAQLARDWAHVPGVGVVGETANEHGTPVSVLRCSGCGVVVTVCPTITEAWGTGCLAEGCPTYDLGRDVDLFWDVLSEYGQIRTGPPPGR